MASTDMNTLVQRFRNRIYDTDPLKNILEGKLDFTDSQLEGYIIEALYDINEAEPQTNLLIQGFPKTSLLLDGAMVFLLQSKGLLHLRNQVSYSDAGFSVNLDDKSGNYAQWMAQIQNTYLMKLKEFKRGRVPRFRGVDSPMGWWGR